jgi:hypothetical protein
MESAYAGFSQRSLGPSHALGPAMPGGVASHSRPLDGCCRIRGWASRAYPTISHGADLPDRTAKYSAPPKIGAQHLNGFAISPSASGGSRYPLHGAPCWFTTDQDVNAGMAGATSKRKRTRPVSTRTHPPAVLVAPHSIWPSANLAGGLCGTRAPVANALDLGRIDFDQNAPGSQPLRKWL